MQHDLLVAVINGSFQSSDGYRHSLEFFAAGQGGNLVQVVLSALQFSAHGTPELCRHIYLLIWRIPRGYFLSCCIAEKLRVPKEARKEHQWTVKALLCTASPTSRLTYKYMI